MIREVKFESQDWGLKQILAELIESGMKGIGKGQGGEGGVDLV
jgi:hypothetical protein